MRGYAPERGHEGAALPMGPPPTGRAVSDGCGRRLRRAPWGKRRDLPSVSPPGGEHLWPNGAGDARGLRDGELQIGSRACFLVRGFDESCFFGFLWDEEVAFE